MKSFIILKSSTAAMRAVTVLKKAKISARHAKITTKKGCRFGIWVNGDLENICRILQVNGIVCLEIKGEGELR
ncbi:MAG: hypothetical protein J1E39_07590 [Eubacterium sp.]|nr:hypothetical protein [Eubacterium sp.]